MSEKPVVTSEEQNNGVELVLSLMQALDAAKETLKPKSTRVELSRPGLEVFHKVIASKILNGYQLGFSMNNGDFHYGFVIGMDDFLIQLYSTEYGKDWEVLDRDKKTNSYAVTGLQRIWIAIQNISSIEENFFGVKHLIKEDQDKLNAERRAMVKLSERWLKGE